MPLPLIAGLPWILSWLSRLIFSRLGAWIVAGLVYLGVYLGTQNIVVEPLLDQIRAYGEGAPSGAVAEWMAFLNIDRSITMVLSAYAAAFAVSSAKVALYRRS